MFNFLLSLVGLPAAARDLSQGDRWQCDPLAHPALRAMTQAQLGDLPIGHPSARQAECGC